MTAVWPRILRRPSLPTSILVGFMIVCGVMVGLDCWRTWQARDIALAEDMAETANLARSLAQHAHDTIQAADIVLADLRERIETDGVAPGQLGRLHQVMAARVAALPLMQGLFLYDAEGNWLATSLASVPAGVNNSDREYFKRHRADPDPEAHVGRPLLSRSDGRWILTVSRRVSDSAGRFAGVVLATISIDKLNGYYATFDVGDRGVITLATQDGILVARKNASQPLIGTDLSGGQMFREFLPRAPAGSFKYTPAISTNQRLGSYRRVAGHPLVVIVAHDFDEVLADWRASTIAHFAINFGVIGVLVLLGLRLVRQMKAQQEAERLYRLLADHSSDAIACTAIDGRRTYASPAFSALTGWSNEEALSRHWKEFIHGDDRAILDDVCARLLAGEEPVSATYRYLRKSGTHLWVEARFRLMPAGRGAGWGKDAQFIINIRDITARKAAEEQLAAAHQALAVQASTDGLTGLANRRVFDETLAVEWKRGARAEQPLSLLLIDVDRFKLYNDRYGHQQGDACLQAISRAILGAVRRPGDLVARYGGEEIVVLLPDTDAEGAAAVAEAARLAIQAGAIQHEGNAPYGVVTASVGIATLLPTDAPGIGGTAALVGTADAALYEAKNRGRNRVATSAELPTAAAAPLPPAEDRRLDVLAQYQDAGATAATDSLDQVARLTAALFRAPIALVSLVGEDQQCFVGRVGLDAEGTPRSISFCAHAIAGEGVFTVADATQDARFAENPLVTGSLGIRFYAGAPLLSPLGQALGSLCIIDRVARPPLTPSEKVLLTDLAALAVSYLDQRRTDSLRNGAAKD